MLNLNHIEVEKTQKEVQIAPLLLMLYLALHRRNNGFISKQTRAHLLIKATESFDEFKYAKGKMWFEYINVETGDILGILDQWDGRTIKNH